MSDSCPVCAMRYGLHHYHCKTLTTIEAKLKALEADRFEGFISDWEYYPERDHLELELSKQISAGI